VAARRGRIVATAVALERFAEREESDLATVAGYSSFLGPAGQLAPSWKARGAGPFFPPTEHAELAELIPRQGGRGACARLAEYVRAIVLRAWLRRTAAGGLSTLLPCLPAPLRRRSGIPNACDRRILYPCVSGPVLRLRGRPVRRRSHSATWRLNARRILCSYLEALPAVLRRRSRVAPDLSYTEVIRSTTRCFTSSAWLVSVARLSLRVGRSVEGSWGIEA